MNSFIGISKSQTTDLAVVAPGIAEALLATALGLAAAIPAVVIYNHFSRRIAAYRALVGDTSAAVLRLVSRDVGKSGIEVMSVKLDHGSDELAENHEINVTPFIDVMLVLLIIFMVAAPLADGRRAGRSAALDGRATAETRHAALSHVEDRPLLRAEGAARQIVRSWPRRWTRRRAVRRTSASSCAPTRPCPMAS